jgi:hypothetical protein
MRSRGIWTVPARNGSGATAGRARNLRRYSRKRQAASEFRQVAEWFLSDLETRAFSPLAKLTVAERIESLVANCAPIAESDLLRLAQSQGAVVAKAAWVADLSDDDTRGERLSAIATNWVTNDAEIWGIRSKLLARAGKQEEAIEAAGRGLSSTNQTAAFWLAYAKAVSLTNGWEVALRATTNAVRATEKHPSETNWLWCAKAMQAELLAKTGKSTNRAALLSEMGLVPPRDPQTPVEALDLTPWYNASLKADWVNQADPRMAMTSLPLGVLKREQTRTDGALGGAFDIRGVIQLAGNTTRMSTSRFPAKVGGITVDRHIGRLHFICGTSGEGQERQQVMELVMRYTDGQESRVPVTYGRDNDVYPRRFNGGVKTYGGRHSKFAWTGRDEVRKDYWPERGWQLCQFTWTNSRPAVPVQSIDLVSKLTAAAPFVVAITTEAEGGLTNDIRVSIPPRSAETPARCVDLSSHYNAGLDDDWHNRRDQGNNLGFLPKGLQTIGGVPFDVRGIIQLSSTNLQQYEARYPSAVTNIIVGRLCKEMHFLSGTGWTDVEGTEIGRLVFHYSDGTTEAQPVRYGLEVRNWQFWPQMSATEKGLPSAVAKIPQKRWQKQWPDYGARLYALSWQNPHPDKSVLAMDFISTMSASAPFLIAITTE